MDEIAFERYNKAKTVKDAIELAGYASDKIQELAEELVKLKDKVKKLFKEFDRHTHCEGSVVVKV